MDGAWRHVLNTWRMDSIRNGIICWRFINGTCRFGSRCNYRHEWPVAPSAQICRYFQKGGCWYGERCRYLHVLQPGVDSSVAGRRSSVPVSSSNVGHAPPDRRGSEPALLQAELMHRQECSRSQLVVNVSEPPQNINRLAVDPDEQSQGSGCFNTGSHLGATQESIQSSEVAQASAINGRNEQETSTETTEDGAAAAASSTLGRVEETEAFLQSKNVTCGICMDKVYEKTDPRNHVFGILPNCNHSFCLQCIMTWRKTRDLGPDVVKSCPQCRVKSAFYVPNKLWVEGQEKESVVAAFKEKFSKKSCSYYSRYRCCPFKADCLYRHDKPARSRSVLYPTEDDDDDDDLADVYNGVDLLNFFIAMTLLSGEDDDDDDFDFPFYLTEEYGY
ncbi:makorin, ring finger protein, 4 isoform X2 [Anabas testudineus]|uniref:makorin, ring finger protein, 4 isoform X2 n=1 Tax=Anabas testudineus TaxID=64144 RepID=UPI000E465540|nr:makorin, ring finger protein, 4 isoform X2 [Anabas testudineus]